MYFLDLAFPFLLIRGLLRLNRVRHSIECLIKIIKLLLNCLYLPIRSSGNDPKKNAKIPLKLARLYRLFIELLLGEIKIAIWIFV